MTLKYRIEYQPFIGDTMTQQAYVIQFSDDGDEWYDLEDDFPEDIAKVLVTALESLKLDSYEVLRPQWVNNNDTE